MILTQTWNIVEGYKPFAVTVFNQSAMRREADGTEQRQEGVEQLGVLDGILYSLETALLASQELWTEKSVRRVLCLSLALQILNENVNRWGHLISLVYTREFRHFYTSIGNLDTKQPSIRGLDHHSKMKVYLMESKLKSRLQQFADNRLLFEKRTRQELVRIANLRQSARREHDYDI